MIVVCLPIIAYHQMKVVETTSLEHLPASETACSFAETLQPSAPHLDPLDPRPPGRTSPRD